MLNRDNPEKVADEIIKKASSVVSEKNGREEDISETTKQSPNRKPLSSERGLHISGLYETIAKIYDSLSFKSGKFDVA